MSKNSLPEGWVRDVDGYGKPYYWHIASGITQREHPLSSSMTSQEERASTPSEPTAVDELSKPGVSELQLIIHRFFVTSLGWRPLSLAELGADHVSRSIQRCIENLSCDKPAVNLVDSVSSWGGDGKKICLDIDCTKGELLIRDAVSVESMLCDDAPVGKALTTHHLQSIRAWGIGTDGNRDFAYVVRDPVSPVGAPVFQCHVMRCEDGDASRIASAIYEGCNNCPQTNGNGTTTNAVINRIEESNEYNENGVEDKGIENSDGSVPPRFDVSALSFALPQPADEPRKVILCHFVGSAEADGPVGKKVLNDAVARALSRHPVERWHFAAVMISPSAVVVRDATDTHAVDNRDCPLLDCRVRYLSFVGIASDDVRVCAFITHAADDTFFAHVFHCEPSAGALSKAIEAACELRFQKCLDSRQTIAKPNSTMPHSASESVLSAYNQKISSTMSNFANSVAKRFAGFTGGFNSSTNGHTNLNNEESRASVIRERANRASSITANKITAVLPNALTNFAQRVGFSSNIHNHHNNDRESDSLIGT